MVAFEDLFTELQVRITLYSMRLNSFHLNIHTPPCSVASLAFICKLNNDHSFTWLSSQVTGALSFDLKIILFIKNVLFRDFQMTYLSKQFVQVSEKIVFVHGVKKQSLVDRLSLLNFDLVLSGQTVKQCTLSFLQEMKIYFCYICSPVYFCLLVLPWKRYIIVCNGCFV